jgi:hypothetical protein
MIRVLDKDEEYPLAPDLPREFYAGTSLSFTKPSLWASAKEDEAVMFLRGDPTRRIWKIRVEATEMTLENPSPAMLVPKEG